MATFSDWIKELTPVSVGQKVTEVASAARMNAIMGLLRALVRGDNIVSGPNVLKQSQDGFVILSSEALIRGGGGRISLPFLLTLVPSETMGADHWAVRVQDGRVNGEFPDGPLPEPMGPGGSGKGYIVVEVPDVSDCLIYLEADFNADTLEMSSLDIKACAAADFPTNEVTTDDPPIGNLNILIGFTWLRPPPSGSPDGTPSTPMVTNSIIGDINFNLIYGAYNGAPAIIPVKTFTDWVLLPPPAP